MATLPSIEVGTWHPLRNTGPVHNTGRMALREMYRIRMRFRDLRVRTRDPGLEIVSSSDSANLSRNP
jgi:hypothetical protein